MNDSLAAAYHEATKYTEEGLRAKGGRTLDFASQPRPFKDYNVNTLVDLTRGLPFEHNPFTGESMEPLDPENPADEWIGRLSRLMFFSYGITAVVHLANGGMHTLRAAPSAGALYPAEMYLAIRDVPGVPDGIYNYQVIRHSLALAWDGNFWDTFQKASFGHPSVERSNVIAILTGVFRRSEWRYEERAYRRILLDTGHLLGNLVIAAEENGMQPYPIAGFQDDWVNRTMFLDELEEAAFAICPLPLEQAEDIPPLGEYRAVPGDVPEDVGLLRGLHRSSAMVLEPDVEPERAMANLDRLAERMAGSETVVRLDGEEWPPEKKDIEEVILRRRSTRRFSGRSLDMVELATMLRYAIDPIETDQPWFFDPSMLDTWVVVHAVEGIKPGAYLYVPSTQELRLVRSGEFKDASAHCCLGQDLARDAAAVVIHTANLPACIERYGDRAYRYMHMDAGHYGQRMNLCATGSGLGASGIGGFFDDEVNQLLGIAPEEIVVYVTTLGRPAGAGESSESDEPDESDEPEESGESEES